MIINLGFNTPKAFYSNQVNTPKAFYSNQVNTPKAFYSSPGQYAEGVR